MSNNFNQRLNELQAKKKAEVDRVSFTLNSSVSALDLNHRQHIEAITMKCEQDKKMAALQLDLALAKAITEAKKDYEAQKYHMNAEATRKINEIDANFSGEFKELRTTEAETTKHAIDETRKEMATKIAHVSIDLNQSLHTVQQELVQQLNTLTVANVQAMSKHKQADTSGLTAPIGIIMPRMRMTATQKFDAVVKTPSVREGPRSPAALRSPTSKPTSPVKPEATETSPKPTSPQAVEAAAA